MPRLVMPLLLAALALGQAACTPTGVAVGAAASAGVAASQERGVKGAARDLRIRAEINRLWFEADTEMYADVGLTIHDGRVLLTGDVPTADARAKAVRLAWQPDGVREIINEVRIAPDGDFADMARDKAIGAKLKSRLLMDGEVRSVNFEIAVSRRVVYLLGIARSAAEHDRVIAQARNIGGVRDVVDHIEVKDT